MSLLVNDWIRELAFCIKRSTLILPPIETNSGLLVSFGRPELMHCVKVMPKVGVFHVATLDNLSDWFMGNEWSIGFRPRASPVESNLTHGLFMCLYRPFPVADWHMDGGVTSPVDTRTTTDGIVDTICDSSLYGLHLQVLVCTTR